MNPKSIRFNAKKDKELIAFFDQRGLKPGIKYLYDFYTTNNNLVDRLVSELKKELSFSTPTTIKKIEIKEIDNEMLMNFVK